MLENVLYALMGLLVGLVLCPWAFTKGYRRGLHQGAAAAIGEFERQQGIGIEEMPPVLSAARGAEWYRGYAAALREMGPINRLPQHKPEGWGEEWPPRTWPKP